MIYSSDTPKQFHDSLPDRCDVLIAGGGVIGVCTAWFLVRAGLRVVLCEKGRVAGEQSSRNWGWVRQQGRDEAELPIMMESNQIWQGLASEIGEDLGFRQQGVMYVAETDREMAGYERWAELAKRHELRSDLLTPSAVARKVNGFTGKWKGAVETPSDGRAEPFVAVPAIARACQRRGVLIIEDCAVRGISRGAGKVDGVITEQGQIRCDAVVCAGGAWSSLLMQHEGYDFPQLSVRSTVARTAPVDSFYEGNAACPDLAIRRREDGGYTIATGDLSEHFVGRESFRYFGRFLPLMRESWQEIRLRFGATGPGGIWSNHRWQEDEVTPFEAQRVLNPQPARSVLKRLREKLANRLPELADIALIESWAGMIDTTPDVVPVIDELPLPGLFLASGFSGHGFGIGPGAGRVTADLVQGKPAGHDLTRFRFARFSDGTKLDTGPSL